MLPRWECHFCDTFDCKYICWWLSSIWKKTGKLLLLLFYACCNISERHKIAQLILPRTALLQIRGLTWHRQNMFCFQAICLQSDFSWKLIVSSSQAPNWATIPSVEEQSLFERQISKRMLDHVKNSTIVKFGFYDCQKDSGFWEKQKNIFQAKVPMLHSRTFVLEDRSTKFWCLRLVVPILHALSGTYCPWMLNMPLPFLGCCLLKCGSKQQHGILEGVFGKLINGIICVYLLSESGSYTSG